MESNGGWVGIVNVIFGIFLSFMWHKKDHAKDHHKIK